MNKPEPVKVKRGLSFVDMLQLLFIALKLMGYIDWPWRQVLAPYILVLGISIIIAIIKTFLTDNCEDDQAP